MKRSTARAALAVALFLASSALVGCDDPTLTQGAAISGCMQTAINSGTVTQATYENVKAQCATQAAQ